MLSHIVALSKMYPSIPICMHQDHGNNEATCMTAIKHGFTSVMMGFAFLEGIKRPQFMSTRE